MDHIFGSCRKRSHLFPAVFRASRKLSKPLKPYICMKNSQKSASCRFYPLPTLLLASYSKHPSFQGGFFEHIYHILWIRFWKNIAEKHSKKRPPKPFPKKKEIPTVFENRGSIFYNENFSMSQIYNFWRVHFQDEFLCYWIFSDWTIEGCQRRLIFCFHFRN